MTEYLTLGSVLYIIEDAGSTVRDLGLIDSALARPRSSALGQDAYPTLTLKSAALLHSMIANHGLVDGNKRLGWQATRAFAVLNQHDIDLTEDEAFDLVIDIAAGRERGVDRIAARLRLRVV